MILFDVSVSLILKFGYFTPLNSRPLSLSYLLVVYQHLLNISNSSCPLPDCLVFHQALPLCQTFIYLGIRCIITQALVR